MSGKGIFEESSPPLSNTFFLKKCECDVISGEIHRLFGCLVIKSLHLGCQHLTEFSGKDSCPLVGEFKTTRELGV